MLVVREIEDLHVGFGLDDECGDLESSTVIEDVGVDLCEALWQEVSKGPENARRASPYGIINQDNEVENEKALLIEVLPGNVESTRTCNFKPDETRIWHFLAEVRILRHFEGRLDTLSRGTFIVPLQAAESIDQRGLAATADATDSAIQTLDVVLNLGFGRVVLFLRGIHDWLDSFGGVFFSLLEFALESVIGAFLLFLCLLVLPTVVAKKMKAMDSVYKRKGEKREII